MELAAEEHFFMEAAADQRGDMMSFRPAAPPALAVDAGDHRELPAHELP